VRSLGVPGEGDRVFRHSYTFEPCRMANNASVLTTPDGDADDLAAEASRKRPWVRLGSSTVLAGLVAQLPRYSSSSTDSYSSRVERVV